MGDVSSMKLRTCTDQMIHSSHLLAMLSGTLCWNFGSGRTVRESKWSMDGRAVSLKQKNLLIKIYMMGKTKNKKVTGAQSVGAPRLGTAGMNEQVSAVPLSDG